MKISSKNLIIVLCGIIILGFVAVVNAQQAIPEGGDDFESAVKLEPGNYQDFNMSSEEVRYYKITIKPGQLITLNTEVKCLSKGIAEWHDFGFVLYDQNRSKVKEDIQMADCQAFDVSEREISWMGVAEDSSNDYYLAIQCKDKGDGVNVREFSFSITDYYDVGSTIDTSGSFNNPIILAPGSYTAYLGNRDQADFYKIEDLQSNTILTAKATPPSDGAVAIIIYDQNRSEINGEYPSNPGAIVTNKATIKEGGDAYVAFKGTSSKEGEIIEYDLTIETQKSAEETGAETTTETDMEMPTEEEFKEAEKQAKQAFEGARDAVKTGVFAWFTSIIIPLIIGFIIFIGIIVVIVVILKKKKK